MNNPQQNNQFQLKASDETLKGVYANLAQVQHSKEEFVLDFISNFPPVATLQSRVVLSPAHMKRMVNAMKENIDRYEATHGKIAETAVPAEMGYPTK